MTSIIYFKLFLPNSFVQNVWCATGLVNVIIFLLLSREPNPFWTPIMLDGAARKNVMVSVFIWSFQLPEGCVFLLVLECPHIVLSRWA